MSSDTTPRTTPFSTPAGSSSSFSSSRLSPGSSLYTDSSFVSHASTPSSSSRSDLDSELDDHDNASLASYSSYDEAEAEWRESLQQLELLVTLVLVPFIGKWVGRKCAYWIWGKAMAWKHPGLEMVVTNRAAFNTAGAIGAASHSASAPL